MTINAQQRLQNIRTKVRLISDYIWRNEGWGVCTGDLERAFMRIEMDRLAGVTPEPAPHEAQRALARRGLGKLSFEQLVRMAVDEGQDCERCG